MCHSESGRSQVDVRHRKPKTWQEAVQVELDVLDIRVSFSNERLAIVDQALLVGLLITVAEAAVVATIFSHIDWSAWLVVLSAPLPAVGSLTITLLRLAVSTASESWFIAKYKKENGCE